MLKLTVYPPGLGEISGSPFSTKAICLMEMSGLDYRLDVQPDPRKTPKGKFPLLKDETDTIPDSDQIRDYLETRYGVDFEPNLTPEQKAVGRLIIRTLEENVYFAIVANRWLQDDHWAVTKGAFFKGMPPVIRRVIANRIRKGVIAQTKGQGMGRHSEPERVARVAKDLAAIGEILGDKQFLFGDSPTAADATAVPMMRAQAFFPLENPLSNLVLNNPKLAAYIERGAQEMYPQ